MIERRGEVLSQKLCGRYWEEKRRLRGVVERVGEGDGLS